MKKAFLSILAIPAILASTSASALEVDVFSGKLVNSALISGDKHMIVVDAQFKRADALRLAAKIIETGKNLDAIYVTHWHPDHNLGSEVLHKIFPEAKILAHPEVIAAIQARLPERAKQLHQRMGADISPTFPMPQAYTATTLMVDGEPVEIIDGLTGDDHDLAVALFVPSAGTLITGDIVFAGTHLWTATTTRASRAAWEKTLDKLAALKPDVVITGHEMPGAPRDSSEINYTRDYLSVFEEALGASKSPEELVMKMKKAYPKAGGMFYLKTGAKALLGGTH